jgi:BirA family biotin operon repressor/biotin-[acetyl-CoA-carboxylase] ligase
MGQGDSVFDSDFLARVAMHRTSTRFGVRIDVREETTSTNDDAARLAAADAPEGMVVVAGSQRAGRGRLGRQWQSPAGAGLYFSTVVRPQQMRGLRETSLLTLAAGVAVADAVQGLGGPRCALKWPNDVVVSRGSDPAGAWRRAKLCGILAEASTSGEGLHYVVVGVGINVLRDAVTDQVVPAATSIEHETGQRVDAARLLAMCLTHLEIEIDALRTSPLAASDLLERWRARARASFGRAVVWESPMGLREGRTVDIDEDGALKIATPQGLERVLSGEVRWR